jgi:hypothetical protein
MNAAKTRQFFPIGLIVVIALALWGMKAVPSVARAAGAAGRLAPAGQSAAVSTGPITFDMVLSAGAAACLPGATGIVTITPNGPVEIMDVGVSGLPPDSEFDFFVLQLPTAPFGVAWYQGDIETDDNGFGGAEFIGRFSLETFAVAQGTGAAPVVHNQPPFPDASSNPPFEPIHMYHLGLWFGSTDEAVAAGCPATQTRFNGDHTAGIQILNTSNFANDQGPLRQIQ